MSVLKGLTFSLIAVVVGCAKAPEIPEETVFRYNEPTGISTLDPAFAREQSSIWACNQLFNGLVQMSPELEVQPAIAKYWEVLDSGKTFTFYLREDILFHPHPSLSDDGRKVTAEDVVYSLSRLTDRETASPGAWTMSRVDTLFAMGDTAVQIQLTEPFYPFLGLLTMKYCSIVPQEVVEELGSQFGRSPIGTGPFKFQMWSADEKLVFRKNPDYFEFEDGVRLPHLEAVAIDFVTDRQAAFMEFLKGELDLLSGLDASYKDELLTRDGHLQEEYAERLDLQLLPYLNTEYLAIHSEDHPALSDVRVRQALNWSVNRQKMMRYLRNGIGKPADGGMVPRGIPSYSPERTGGYVYNVDSAKALLAQAGYPDGKGLPTIVLSSTSNYLDLCEYLQSGWNELGIPVQVEVLPAPTLREGKAKGSLPFFRASWIADYPDAENYLSLFYSPNHTPNGPNYTFFSNADFDALYEESQLTTDPELRNSLYMQMDSIVVYEAPVVPLFYDEVVRFVPVNVHNLQPNPLNLLELKTVWKD